MEASEVTTHTGVLFKIDVLKNLVKFRRKHLCQMPESLFK